MKTKQLYIIIAAILLAACSNNSKPKIGFLLPNYTDSRYLKDSVFFFNKIQELGGEVIIKSANNDFSIQEEQALEMLDNGVKILVIAAVNQNLAANIVRQAHDHGAKVIAYERLINNCDLDYFITYDHYKAGIQQAEYVANLKPAGNYVILGGDKNDKNAELLKAGQMLVLKPLIDGGKLNVVFDSYIEDWSKAESEHVLTEILKLNQCKIDVILAANDGIAQGAIEALKNNAYNDAVVITGMDAEFSACQSIIAGNQSMTIYKSFRKQACNAAELAFKLALQEKDGINCSNSIFNGYKNIPSITLLTEALDSKNILQKVTVDKLYSAKELLNIQ